MPMPTPTSAQSIASHEGERRRAGTNRLRWIEAFETGSAEIDDMHRKLVQDCNSILLLLENEAAWPLIVGETRKLVADCIAHFREEERFLQRTGFPRCADHTAAHHRLEHELNNLVVRMEEVDGSTAEHREYPKLLGPSLIELILRHDLDYKSHVLHHNGQ